MYGKFSAQPVFNFLMILIFWEVNKSPEQMGKLNVLDTHKGKEESNVSVSSGLYPFNSNKNMSHGKISNWSNSLF